jgi:tetratricopeptide (TPR) repeat protein
MQQKFTRNEVARMLGIRTRELDRWSKLGLIAPARTSGVETYGFADLVALKTLKQLTKQGVPSRRLHQALAALLQKIGEGAAPLSRLQISTHRRKVVVGEAGRAPIEPISGQMLFAFESEKTGQKVRSLPSRTAEEWFDIGLAYDADRSTMREAADAYRRAVSASPNWVEAHLNLGTALFHLGQIKEAYACFKKGCELGPENVLAHFNMGCVLERMGKRRAAIKELRQAVELEPDSADAHLNLALLYEAEGQAQKTRDHLTQYLRLQPQGQWAKFARSKLPAERGTSRGKITPFRRRG